MQKKVSILYVITKLELGGAQKQLISLLTLLDKTRYNIFLFTAENGLLIDDACSINGLTLIRSKFLERQINPLKDILALIEIYLFIRKNNIDIVHTHSSKAGILGRLAAKFAGVRLKLHTVHGWSFNDYQPIFARAFFIQLEKFIANFTDAIIVVSNYDRQVGLKSRIGIAHRYTLIRYGINYDEFRKEYNAKEKLGIGADNVLVGMISCFKPQKSPQDFIKLAYLIKKISPSAKFILIGDGFLRKKLESLIDRLNLRHDIVLTGWRKDIPCLLSTIDIFVLTSLWEGLPVTVLEAMASGKPVAVTDTGGVREVVVEDKTGYIAPRGNIKEMVRKIEPLLRDEGLRRRMGQNGRDSLASDFTIESMVKNSENLYEKLFYDRKAVYVN